MASSSGIHVLASAAATTISRHPAIVSQIHLDTVMLLGCLSALATGVSYIYRRRSRTAMLTFAASLAVTGLYGFVEGAWPLGLLESAWAIETTRRGLLWVNLRGRRKLPFAPDLASRQSRYREVYGPN